jgi:hypothetical protein
VSPALPGLWPRWLFRFDPHPLEDERISVSCFRTKLIARLFTSIVDKQKIIAYTCMYMHL